MVHERVRGGRMEFARSGPSGVDDEILRREIETQKELYRLQMMDEESSSMSKRLKKKGKAK